MGLIGKFAGTLVGLAIVGLVVALVASSVFWVLFTGSRAVYVTNQDNESHTVSVAVEGTGAFNDGTETVECTLPPGTYAKVTETTQAHLLSLSMNPHRIDFRLADGEGRISAKFGNGVLGYKSAVAWVEDTEQLTLDGTTDSYDLSKVVYYGRRDPCTDGPMACLWGSEVSC